MLIFQQQASYLTVSNYPVWLTSQYTRTSMNVHSTNNTQELNLTQTSLGISFKSANTSFLNAKMQMWKYMELVIQNEYKNYTQKPYHNPTQCFHKCGRQMYWQQKAVKSIPFKCSVLGLQYKMLYMITEGRGVRKLSKY